MDECLNFLIQATQRNKERMKVLVQEIPTPNSDMDHIAGLEEAFKLLNSSGTHHFELKTSFCLTRNIFSLLMKLIKTIMAR